MTASRAVSRTSPRTPRSSTSISTRPRSARTSPPTVPIVGDVKSVLRRPQQVKLQPAKHTDWRDRSQARAREAPEHRHPGDREDPAAVRDQVDLRRVRRRRLLRDRRRPAPDVGGAVLLDRQAAAASSPPVASARWASRCRRQSARSSPSPNSTVWAICGDGGFQMTSQELATVVDTSCRSSSRSSTTATLAWSASGRSCSTRTTSPPCACTSPTSSSSLRPTACSAMRVTDKDQVQASIDLALAHPGPVLIDFQVEEYENTFPMVPPGASLQETVDSPYEARRSRPTDARRCPPATGGAR